MNVAIRPDSVLQDRAGLYFRTGRTWHLRSAERDQNSGKITASLRHKLGEVTVRQDTVPPWVGRLRVWGLSRRTPKFSFRYGDDLAGIDYEGVKAYIDSNLIVPEIDGEHHRAFYQFTDPLERGSHLLTVHVPDNVGNTTTVGRRFVVR
ncbi:MAG: hypothetical protein KAJ12_13075 [Bacteroidetes bacterium]|nr:hypothetical protein [Bacteroidota bacterium]